MTEAMKQRCIDEANFIIMDSATVRETAAVFGVSKSTVHKDMVERLPYIMPKDAELVRKVFEQNKKERASRGGNSTKLKYLAFCS